MKPLRVSAISYLNTAPLMWDFEHGKAHAEFDISYTVPSQCATNLRAGTADIGIIPAAAYASNPDLVIIPDVAIASRQAVRSILLVSKVPLDKIRRVALDNSSLTSVALTKVLFAMCWGGERTYVSKPPSVEAMLAEHDAALVIGDPALQIDTRRFIAIDLAEEWIRWTGKPFVFAFWAVRRSAWQDLPHRLDLAGVFQQSRDHGLQRENIAKIARNWSERLGLTEENVTSYLSENIHYYLDSDCLEGLQLFYRYAHECGALPAPPRLRFVDERKAAVS